VSKIGTPMVIGAILVPRGEFSLVLAKAGVDAGLVGAQLYPIVGLTVLVTAIASPIVEKSMKMVNARRAIGSVVAEQGSTGS
ncbi:MAG TPA: cation:proton antiporter, partial [Candidatus Bathyarchaeia archaeon]|nr:cation:proton antiporter [Candidatus Bathyarchaeia archaeon]